MNVAFETGRAARSSYYQRHVEDGWMMRKLLQATERHERCQIARANLLSLYQLTLDLNEPAALREHRRSQLPGLVKALVDAFES